MKSFAAENVWKSYGRQSVLERINLRVEGKAFVTMVGASGCGKTTFLKMLMGDERPTRGRLMLDSLPLSAEPGPDRGVVFQRYSVFPHLTVLGNVLLGLELQQARLSGRLFGKARKAARERAAQGLQDVGLHAARDKYPSQLSGGMQQRLAIAQAFIMQPRVLLLDEPFGALDPGIRRDMHQLITQLWEAREMGVFMITHDLQEGFELGTRLLVFDKTRADPQAPDAYGATITFDLPLSRRHPDMLKEIREAQKAPDAEALA